MNEFVDRKLPSVGRFEEPRFWGRLNEWTLLRKRGFALTTEGGSTGSTVGDPRSCMKRMVHLRVWKWTVTMGLSWREWR